MFCILQDLLTQKTQLIKALHSLDSSRPYERLLENPKTVGSRESFLPEKNFKTWNTVNFLIKHPDFGCLKINLRYEIQTLIFFHMPLPGFSIMGVGETGVGGAPHPSGFFETPTPPASKLMPPMGRNPHLKIKSPPPLMFSTPVRNPAYTYMNSI